jgi:hypothetical protein
MGAGAWGIGVETLAISRRIDEVAAPSSEDGSSSPSVFSATTDSTGEPLDNSTATIMIAARRMIALNIIRIMLFDDLRRDKLTEDPPCDEYESV